MKVLDVTANEGASDRIQNWLRHADAEDPRLDIRLRQVRYVLDEAARGCREPQRGCLRRIPRFRQLTA